MRLDRLLDPHELVHQLLVDVQPAGGVDDHDVAALGAWPARPPTPPTSTGSASCPARRPAPGATCRASGAARRRRGAGGRTATSAGLRFCLASSRASLPRPSSCPSPGGRPSGSPSAAGSRTRASMPAVPISDGQLLVDDLDDLLAGRQALASPPRPSARSFTAATNSLDDAEVDVGLEQREADLAHRLVDVVLAQAAPGRGGRRACAPRRSDRESNMAGSVVAPALSRR